MGLVIPTWFARWWGRITGSWFLAALFGAIFLIWVDVGRIIKPPAEIPVESDGVPGRALFLWMIKVRRYELCRGPRHDRGRQTGPVRHPQPGDPSGAWISGCGEGEFVGLIGPWRQRKSMPQKRLQGAPPPGELTSWDDLLAMSNREMAQRLAVMVQEQEAAFDFTVEEVVMMGRQACKRPLRPTAGRTGRW